MSDTQRWRRPDTASSTAVKLAAAAAVTGCCTPPRMREIYAGNCAAWQLHCRRADGRYGHVDARPANRCSISSVFDLRSTLTAVVYRSKPERFPTTKHDALNVQTGAITFHYKHQQKQYTRAVFRSMDKYVKYIMRHRVEKICLDPASLVSSDNSKAHGEYSFS